MDKGRWKKLGCSTFEKLNLVGQISAAATSKHTWQVVTQLLLLAVLYSGAITSKYQHYSKSGRKKYFPKTWVSTRKPVKSSDKTKEKQISTLQNKMIQHKYSESNQRTFRL